LSMNWSTNIGTSGSSEALLSKSKAEIPSEYIPIEVHDWNKYKEHVAQLEGGRYLFRGQSEP